MFKILRDRSQMLTQSRTFFQEKGILEVDCPMITSYPSIDAHIDLIPTNDRYLHTSPEYGMKRLLVEGIGDIYQLSHVFRKGEIGEKHNPEFMMAEWYRIGFSFEEMIEETLEYCHLFLGKLPSTILTYHEAFHKYLGIDYKNKKDISNFLIENEIQTHTDDLDELLNITLGLFIEPHLGQDELAVITLYPASQAALAKRKGDVAERFEIYHQGLELANGYHELGDPLEQRKRFEEANEQRVKMGKEKLPLDERFLRSLEKGLPDCCGVAVGFDRLMMLRHRKKSIDDILPFSWKSI